MQLRGLLLICAATLACGLAPAKADVRIGDDRGGQIGQYLQAFATVRSSGERVVIDGNCLSACTLVLGVVPRDRICATERARFGFHAAWLPDTEGKPVTSPMGTQALWNIYPSSVKRWINSHGGLTRKMIYLEGPQMARIVPSCTTTTASAQVRHRTAKKSQARFTTRTVRYESASATGYRR